MTKKTEAQAKEEAGKERLLKEEQETKALEEELKNLKAKEEEQTEKKIAEKIEETIQQKIIREEEEKATAAEKIKAGEKTIEDAKGMKTAAEKTIEEALEAIKAAEKTIEDAKGMKTAAEKTIEDAKGIIIVEQARIAEGTLERLTKIDKEAQQAPRREAVILTGREFARAFHKVAQGAITDKKFNKDQFKQGMNALLGDPTKELGNYKKLQDEWEKAQNNLDLQINALANAAEEAHNKGSLQFSSSFSRACKKFLQAVTVIMKVTVNMALLGAPSLLYHHIYKDRYFLTGENSVAKGAVGLATVVFGLIAYKTQLLSVKSKPKSKPYANALRDLTSSFEKELDTIIKKADILYSSTHDNVKENFTTRYLENIKSRGSAKKSRE